MVLTWLGCTRWVQVQVQVRCDGVITPTPQRGTHIDANVTVRATQLHDILSTNSRGLSAGSSHLRVPSAQGLHTTTAPRHGDAALSVVNQDALLTQDEGWRRGGNVR
jgi:hypothetical protein